MHWESHKEAYAYHAFDQTHIRICAYAHVWHGIHACVCVCRCMYMYGTYAYVHKHVDE